MNSLNAIKTRELVLRVSIIRKSLEYETPFSPSPHKLVS